MSSILALDGSGTNNGECSRPLFVPGPSTVKKVQIMPTEVHAALAAFPLCNIFKPPCKFFLLLLYLIKVINVPFHQLDLTNKALNTAYYAVDGDY